MTGLASQNDNKLTTATAAPGRRLWLKTSFGLVLAGLFADGRAAPARAMLAGFMRVSSRLTRINKLDAAAGQVYLDLLVKRVGDSRAAAIVAAPNPQAPELVKAQNQLVADWYSGQAVDDNKNLKCVDYTGALLWRACDFTKPDGQCGGATGYWALPPAGEGGQK